MIKVGLSIPLLLLSLPAFKPCLTFTVIGFDEFDAQLNAARSPLFGEWALLAGAGIVSNGSTTAVTPVAPGTGGGFSGGDDDASEDDDESEGAEVDSDDEDD